MEIRKEIQDKMLVDKLVEYNYELPTKNYELKGLRAKKANMSDLKKNEKNPTKNRHKTMSFGIGLCNEHKEFITNVTNNTLKARFSTFFIFFIKDK